MKGLFRKSKATTSTQRNHEQKTPPFNNSEHPGFKEASAAAIDDSEHKYLMKLEKRNRNNSSFRDLNFETN